MQPRTAMGEVGLTVPGQSAKQQCMRALPTCPPLSPLARPSLLRCSSPLPKLLVISQPGLAGRQQVLQGCSCLLPGRLAQAHKAVESCLRPKHDQRWLCLRKILQPALLSESAFSPCIHKSGSLFTFLSSLHRARESWLPSQCPVYSWICTSQSMLHNYYVGSTPQTA